jgi:large subunit ribosomal protein L22
MADEKNTEKDQAKKPARRKPAAKKPAASSGGGSGTSRKTPVKPKKETATRGKGAAEATSKTADSKASEASTSEAPAKKPAARKPAAKKSPAKPKAGTKAKAPAAKKAATKPKAAPERPIVNARARYVRVAPRKARLVADQVRGLPIEDARALLRFSTRSAAQDIRKLIESAAANAEANHDLVADDLLIKDIHVDEGPTLRRYRPRALGRATRINKRTSHIVVALTPED